MGGRDGVRGGALGLGGRLVEVKMDADIPAVSSSVSSLEVAKQIIHQSEGIRSRLQLMVMKAKEKLIKGTQLE